MGNNLELSLKECTVPIFWIIHCQKFFTGVLFKFAGCITDACTCHCMSLQSAGVSF